MKSERVIYVNSVPYTENGLLLELEAQRKHELAKAKKAA